jgi:hypothetical protein
MKLDRREALERLLHAGPAYHLDDATEIASPEGTWRQLLAEFLHATPAYRTTTPVRVPAPLQPAPTPRVRPRPGRPTDGWLNLSPLSALGAFRADDGGRLVAEVSSPDGGADYLIRNPTRDRYRLEVVVRDVEALPAVISVRGRMTGSGLVLLVPAVGSEIGPSASQIDLVGFDPGTAWEASMPEPVDRTTVWDTEVVAASVRAAANEVTRNAWRRIGEIVPEDIRRVIIQELE